VQSDSQRFDPSLYNCLLLGVQRKLGSVVPHDVEHVPRLAQVSAVQQGTRTGKVVKDEFDRLASQVNDASLQDLEHFPVLLFVVHSIASWFTGGEQDGGEHQPAHPAKVPGAADLLLEAPSDAQRNERCEDQAGQGAMRRLRDHLLQQRRADAVAAGIVTVETGQSAKVQRIGYAQVQA
jgi:hypothetical protein